MSELSNDTKAKVLEAVGYLYQANFGNVSITTPAGNVFFVDTTPEGAIEKAWQHYAFQKQSQAAFAFLAKLSASAPHTHAILFTEQERLEFCETFLALANEARKLLKDSA